MAGSIVGQGVGIAVGVQDKFSWKSVALAGIGAGVTAGLAGAAGAGANSGLFGIKSPYVEAAVRQATSNVVTQGVAIAAGLQEKFDWRSVAVSAVAAPLNKYLSTKFEGTDLGKSLARQFGDTGRDIATGILTGTATQLVRMQVYGGGKIDWATVAADAFGNAIGNAIAARLARREAFIAGQLERHAAIAKDLQTSGLGDGTFDIDTARRLAKLQFRASERPQRMTDAMQERMVDLAMRTHGAGPEEQALAQAFIADSRAESRALRVAGADAVFPKVIEPGMTLEAVTIWGTPPQMSAVGQFLREWQDPLGTAGRGFIRVGEFIEEHWWAKYSLIGLEAITTPVLFAGRKLLEQTPLGKKISDLQEEGIRRGAEYINGTARLNNPQLSTEMTAGLLLGAALVAGGISLFSKLAPMAGGFLKKVTDTIPARGAGGGDALIASGSTKPAWLRRLDEGNAFNAAQSSRYPHNEVYIDKAGGGYYRLDSYNARTGEIVSRKFTQFGDIQESTGRGYLNELAGKYAPGSKIANVPSSGGLAGQRLQGQMILEVPVQTAPIPRSVLDAANNLGIIIRDVNGKVY
jgi:hypothetical protein